MVQPVDHQGVPMTFRMFVQVRVTFWQVGVVMCHLDRIFRRPKPDHGDHSSGTEYCQTISGDCQAEGRPEPASQRIGHKPRCVGHGELCSKYRWAVLFAGGSVQDAPDRGLGRREPEPYYRP